MRHSAGTSMLRNSLSSQKIMSWWRLDRPLGRAPRVVVAQESRPPLLAQELRPPVAVAVVPVVPVDPLRDYFLWSRCRLLIAGCQPQWVLTKIMVLVGAKEKEQSTPRFPDVRLPPSSLSWAPDAPSHLRCNLGGLCVRGKCTSRLCSAFGKQVVCNPFYQSRTYTWRVGDLSVPVQCPLCHAPVLPENVAFNNCFFRVSGTLRLSPPIITSTYEGKWQEAGDCYVSWEVPGNGSAVLWRTLEFSVRENPNAKRQPKQQRTYQ
ncbi:hypothetical protein BASA81_002186 [Batrachochytrium salamandrivorans]|nr:hypothetical protein BASA81_002186 [Batrachochytrium salamandrivorans]